MNNKEYYKLLMSYGENFVFKHLNGKCQYC